MKNVFASSTDTWFKCGCQSGGKPVEWRITARDEKGVMERPADTVVDHNCSSIIAFRQYKGIRRFYLNKKAVETRRKELISAIIGILKTGDKSLA